MDEQSENWEDYPYAVEWVERMNQWALEYQVGEFIPADDDGQDPSGRVPNFLAAADENHGKLERSHLWTLEDTGDSEGRRITSEFSSGDWRVRGWYLAGVPYVGDEISLPAGLLLCSQCRGERVFEDSEGEEVDCDLCWDGVTLFVELEETDFSLFGE